MCKGQAPDGTKVCTDRERCQRFVDTPVKQQNFQEYYKAGEMCQHYVGLDGSWNEKRMDVIGGNGNVGY
jgi:hypothetical protein